MTCQREHSEGAYEIKCMRLFQQRCSSSFSVKIPPLVLWKIVYVARCDCASIDVRTNDRRKWDNPSIKKNLRLIHYRRSQGIRVTQIWSCAPGGREWSAAATASGLKPWQELSHKMTWATLYNRSSCFFLIIVNDTITRQMVGHTIVIALRISLCRGRWRQLRTPIIMPSRNKKKPSMEEGVCNAGINMS